MIKRLLSRSLPSSPIIALLTDFGLSDHYVGTMKAVIASIHPEARVIDISHEVGAQQVLEGAYLLWSSYKFFPARTVFVSVVDPGVGTGRKIIAMQAKKYTFLAPDNGILDFVRADEAAIASVEVRKEDSPYILSDVSSTFHGRDIFAPVAAYLARGVSFDEIGVSVLLPPPDTQFAVPGEEGGKPLILHVDHFGNIVTNVRVNRSRSLVKYISVGGKRIDRWINSYQEAPAKTPCLIVGSSGLIEVVMKNESARVRLKATVKSPVRIHLA